jgi:predicted glycoside hydrolase/deacetylase ChbG (UPF0249 family)
MKFYGQTNEGLPLLTAINVERLIEILSRLPDGLNVLACHPGYADDLNTMYRLERYEELKTLCDPGVRDAITNLGIKLCSFDDWIGFRNHLAYRTSGTGN